MSIHLLQQTGHANTINRAIASSPREPAAELGVRQLGPSLVCGFREARTFRRGCSLIPESRQRALALTGRAPLPARSVKQRGQQLKSLLRRGVAERR